MLWFGDIISLYAVAAVPLYWLRRWSIRRLVVAASVCLTAPVLLSAVILVAAVVTGDTGHGDSGHGPAALLPAFALGRYPEMLPANWAFLSERWELALLSGRPIRLLGMFILGMCAVRLRRQPPAKTAIPTGSVAYAMILWPWFSSRGPITRVLAAAGRLSLSHYLTQSLVLAALFYGCGLGLWGRVGIAWAVCIALAIAVLQTLCSQQWLRRLGSGPAERVLRRLTYGDLRHHP